MSQSIYIWADRRYCQPKNDKKLSVSSVLHPFISTIASTPIVLLITHSSLLETHRNSPVQIVSYMCLCMPNPSPIIELKS
jgi:hypothetical protein